MSITPARCDVSVIIPTLNESENIDPLLTDVLAAFERRSLSCEILVADGGSTDGTQDRTRLWATHAAVRLVSGDGKRGLAGDVLTAAKQATGHVLVVMDGDQSHPAAVAPELAHRVLEGSCDMAIGSRYIRQGRTEGWPWQRRLLSRVATLFTWPVVDVKDPLSGFFAIRRQDLLALTDHAQGFKIGLEALLRGHDRLRLVEVPITFHDRRLGRSKMGIGEVLAFLQGLARLAGGKISSGNAARFAVVGLMGMLIDIGIFVLLRQAAFSLATAHILSFFAATLANYSLNQRWTFARSDAPGFTGWIYLKFLAVCLMAMFLRGGVLGLIIDQFGWPALAAILAGVAVAAIVNYLGCVFYVFTELDGTTALGLRWRVAAVAMVAYVLLLRLAYMGHTDLLPEEAYYWNYAQHPALSYLDHPPMVAWMIGATTAVFGDTEFAVRLGPMACWAVTLCFSFAYARKIFDKETALLTAMLVALLPFYFVTGFLATPDAPLMACWAGGLFFLHRALVEEKPSAWLGVGACVGVGLLSKYTIVLLGLAALVYVLFDRRSRRWFTHPAPYVAAAIAMILFSPVMFWNATNGWASFIFQSTRRVQEVAHFSLPELIGSIALLLTPLGMVGVLQAVVANPRRRVGLGYQSSVIDRDRMFVVVFAAVPLLVFTAFSLRHAVKLNWTGPLWLAVLPVLAGQVRPKPTARLKPLAAFGQRLWQPTILATLLVFGGLLHYLSLGLPGAWYTRIERLPVAWQEMGALVEQLEDRLEKTHGHEPLVVGMDKYFIASELAFYRRHGLEGPQRTASRHLFFNSGLMYEYWYPPDQQLDQSMLLVSLEQEDIADSRLAGRVESLGPIESQPIMKDRRSVGQFYWRLAKGYRGLNTPQAATALMPSLPLMMASH